MIIYMYRVMCFTNRKLCDEDYIKRLTDIAYSEISATVLREKDLSEDEYYELAKKVNEIYKKAGKTLILHNFYKVAKRLDIDKIHLPLSVLESMNEEERAYFKILGASCHSIEDAVKAQKYGCTYITAGHIYATDCKRGVSPRGLDFLREITHKVSIPVWAIGGISMDNIEEVASCGAYGGCIMSGLMKNDYETLKSNLFTYFS